MPPAKVVEGVDVVANRVLRLPVRREENAGEQLVNQRTEETLGNRVIPAITFSAHACSAFKISQTTTIAITGIRASAIRMMNQPHLRSPLIHRRIKSGQG